MKGISLIIGAAILAILVVAVLPTFTVLNTEMSATRCLDYLEDRGTVTLVASKHV